MLLPLREVTSGTFESDHDPSPRVICYNLTISIKQDKILRRELEVLSNAQSIFWTDSTIVLRYFKNETKRYHTFVANRIAVILDGSEPHQWIHVRGHMNPADDASRGLSADDFHTREAR